MEPLVHGFSGTIAAHGHTNDRRPPPVAVHLCACLTALLPTITWGADLPVEGPALGPVETRITQDQIASGAFSLRDIRMAGLRIFATPFNRQDGYGEGPMEPADPDHTSPGNRPMLGDNGTMLRINGLDSQTCLECHNQASAATVPMTFGVGGAAGISATALFQPRFFDVGDAAGSGFAAFDGRAINPLSLFGVGGVQLLANEMTTELQRLRAVAAGSPSGARVDLVSKGVDFGYLIADGAGGVDTANVRGIDEDLVVRPFGRKGEFSTLRGFDVVATQFHLGMQPVEVVGEGVDADRDGVVNELFPGEISALEIFLATMDRPDQENRDKLAQRGFEHFLAIGCAECHRPALETESRFLGFSTSALPPTEEDAFYWVDLTRGPPKFNQGAGKGIIVELFSDLRRHDMGPDLAESFHLASDDGNAEFITAKLWGVADTAPYLHDGRALTLAEAIRWHGGEARNARDRYLALTPQNQAALLAFLNTLRNPRFPNRDVLPAGD